LFDSISTVNGRSNKKRKEKKKLTLGKAEFSGTLKLDFGRVEGKGVFLSER